MRRETNTTNIVNELSFCSPIENTVFAVFTPKVRLDFSFLPLNLYV